MGDGLIDRLPHRGAMRLIGEVREVREGFARCSVTLENALWERWSFNGLVPAHIAIEMIAQSAAVAMSSDVSRTGQSGMIMQVRSFSASTEGFARGARLICAADVEIGLEGRYASVTGTVCENDEVLCQASLSLWISEK